MFFTHSSRESEKIPVHFHCPACGERDVNGLAWTEHQFSRLLGIVLILDERLHWVSGHCCQRKLISRVPPKKLCELDADDIDTQRILSDRVSPVKITLLLGAFLFGVVPVIGPLFLLLAWLPNGSSRTWFRLACRICLFLHLVTMNALVLLEMAAHKK